MMTTMMTMQKDVDKQTRTMRKMTRKKVDTVMVQKITMGTVGGGMMECDGLEGTEIAAVVENNLQAEDNLHVDDKLDAVVDGKRRSKMTIIVRTAEEAEA